MSGSWEIEDKPLPALAYHGKFEKRELKPENVLVLIRIESLSGCSALIFEAIWFRIARTELGITVWSATVVPMAFMTGLGIGNGISAYRGNSILNSNLLIF